MIMKKKIGIITHWWSSQNYGQKLQAYALKTYLENLGFDVSLIRYQYAGQLWPIYYYYRNAKLSVLKFWGKMTNKQNSGYRQFETFVHSYLNPSKILTSFKQCSQYCKNLDVVIVGSDQVWGSYLYYDEKKKKLNSESLDIFTLNIGLPIKRISYAASIGNNYPPEVIRQLFIEKVRKLDAISVREVNLKRYLLEYGVNSVIVPDPVVLLDRSDYIHFIGKEFESKRYKTKCFQYSLTWESSIDFKSLANFLSKRFGESFLFSSGNSNTKPVSQTYFPTVKEWLSFIGNTELFITNSFHGVMFAIIMHTPFYYISLKQKEGQVKDDRISTILDFCNLSDRVVSNLNELNVAIEKKGKVNWENVDNKIQILKAQGIDFLNKELMKPITN